MITNVIYIYRESTLQNQSKITRYVMKQDNMTEIQDKLQSTEIYL